MTFEQCEANLKKQLQTLYDAGEAAAIADRLLEEYTQHNRQQRRLNAHQALPVATLQKTETAITELLQGKPLQYVLGYADFFGLTFQVDSSVLIPRPETEELVDWIIKDHNLTRKQLQILDIGTGSGCIPVTLKKHLPQAVVTSVDVSEQALSVAARNAATNSAIVHFLQLDFLEENAWPQLGMYDVIVSNPPYIPQQESTAMENNVTAWEPATALFVPNEKPLLFYEKIAAFSKTHLHHNGAIYLETHKDFAAAVEQLFTQQNYAAEMRKDLHGNDRMVKVVNHKT